MKMIRHMRILVGAIQRAGSRRLLARVWLRLRHRRLLRTHGKSLPRKRLSSSDGWKSWIGEVDVYSGSSTASHLEVCGNRLFANNNWLSSGQSGQMEYARELPRMELFYHDWLLHPNYNPLKIEAFLTQYLIASRDRLSDWSHEWHPYSVSNRLISWVLLLLSGKVSESIHPELIQQIGWQADYVEHFLEEDIGANHLLKNKFSLAVVDLLIYPDIGGKSATSYIDEAVSQHLEDGGHYELCPMYHAKVLADLILFQSLLDKPNPKLNQLIVASSQWLQEMTFADGKWCNFGDSWWIPKLKKRLMLPAIDASLVNPETVYLQDSGFVRFSSGPGRWTAIMDVGGFGPDFNPGHGHADALSLQISLGDWLLVPDPGVLHYSPNDQRAFLKSSQAHNGPTLANRDYVQMTAGFRVGRAASVGQVELRESCIEASHDGFQNLLTKRVVSYSESELLVTDCWTPNGKIRNADTAWLRWLIHAPFDSIHEQSINEDSLSFIVSGPDNQQVEISVRINSGQNADFRISSSWFSSSFGQMNECTEVCVSVPKLTEIEQPLKVLTTFRIVDVN